MIRIVNNGMLRPRYDFTLLKMSSYLQIAWKLKDYLFIGFRWNFFRL